MSYTHTHTHTHTHTPGDNAHVRVGHSLGHTHTTPHSQALKDASDQFPVLVFFVKDLGVIGCKTLIFCTNESNSLKKTNILFRGFILESVAEKCKSFVKFGCQSNTHGPIKTVNIFSAHKISIIYCF